MIHLFLYCLMVLSCPGDLVVRVVQAGMSDNCSFSVLEVQLHLHREIHFLQPFRLVLATHYFLVVQQDLVDQLYKHIAALLLLQFAFVPYN